ncbi:tryptophan synthase subunit beta [Candidatus Vidania fulgoroideorum]
MKPNKLGFYGEFGGQFVPEILLEELNKITYFYKKIFLKKNFLYEFYSLLLNKSTRPTPICYAKNLSKKILGKIFFKREDLNFCNSHKINNVLGQIILAKIMKKKEIIAETGAGQHGVSVSQICSNFGVKCRIFIGKKDYKKQNSNVKKILAVNAKLVIVKKGDATLKEAVNEAIRYWTQNINETYYLIGSVVGPHPFPLLVSSFQSIIGKECKIQKKIKFIISCIGGGSNSIGIFSEFIKSSCKLFGIEAGGKKKKTSAVLRNGKIGILHGSRTFILKKPEAYSIASGLRYPSVGPEHSYLKEKKNIYYTNVKDNNAIKAFKICCKKEGIIPSFETSHAIAYGIKIGKNFKGKILINFSGSGDKDL